jgi:hypothetical protein
LRLYQRPAMAPYNSEASRGPEMADAPWDLRARPFDFGLGSFLAFRAAVMFAEAVTHLLE